MPDLTQWSITDIVQRWWWLVSAVGTVFAAGFSLAHWLRSRKLEIAESALALERAKPKTSITLGVSDTDVGGITNLLRFDFSKPEFIHPEIVEELEGWLSDGLPVYAAVDLEGAMKSNRFFRPQETRPAPDSSGWIRIKEEPKTKGSASPYYMYKFIGVTPSGIHLIQTASYGGGSGVFCHVLFMRFQTDEVLTSTTLETTKTRRRILLRCIGHLLLGDRYDGTVTYANNILTIGKGTRMGNGHVPAEEQNIRVE